MATRMNTTKANPNTNSAASSLCEYCRQKPKFGGYQYCSKTCAKQVATLCNYCHKKPKFANFDYCGKNCAAAAGNNGSIPNRNGTNAAGGHPSKGAKGTNNGPQQPFTKAPPNTGAAIPINPAQIAQLVAQQMPQVQTLLANAAAGAAGAALASAVAGTAAAPAGRGPSASTTKAQSRANQAPVSAAAARAPASSAKQTVNNPFLNSQTANSGGGALTNQSASTLPPLDPDDEDSDELESDEVDDLPECLLPGCEKPVHVNTNGTKASAYCSKRHREEAVADGLVPACIMCLTMPQSDMDYFCSRACREEALNKAADLST